MEKETEQALQLIKGLLDFAVSKGIYQDLNACVNVATAFELIAKKLSEDGSKLGNN